MTSWLYAQPPSTIESTETSSNAVHNDDSERKGMTGVKQYRWETESGFNTHLFDFNTPTYTLARLPGYLPHFTSLSFSSSPSHDHICRRRQVPQKKKYAFCSDAASCRQLPVVRHDVHGPAVGREPSLALETAHQGRRPGSREVKAGAGGSGRFSATKLH